MSGMRQCRFWLSDSYDLKNTLWGAKWEKCKNFLGKYMMVPYHGKMLFTWRRAWLHDDERISKYLQTLSLKMHYFVRSYSQPLLRIYCKEINKVLISIMAQEVPSIKIMMEWTIETQREREREGSKSLIICQMNGGMCPWQETWRIS